MYYEEAIIDGVICCRYLPDVPFHPLSTADLTARIVNLETKLNELREDPRLALQPDHIERVVDLMTVFGSPDEDPELTLDEVEALQVMQHLNQHYHGTPAAA